MQRKFFINENLLSFSLTVSTACKDLRLLPSVMKTLSSGIYRHVFWRWTGRARIGSVLAAHFMLVFYLAYSLTLKMEPIYSSETPLTVTGLHGVTYQKLEVFVVCTFRLICLDYTPQEESQFL
jgi:hypothetical protein